MSDDRRVFRLLASANQIASAADQASRAFARALARVLRDLERQLVPLVTTAAEESPTAIVRGAQVAATRNAIRQAMERAGYPVLVDVSTNEPLDTVAARVLSAPLGRDAGAFIGQQDAQLAALKRLYTLDLLDEGDDVARALWQATVRGVFGSRSAQDILADLAILLDKRESQIATLYDTSVSIFGRQVAALEAGDEPEARFLYAGPNDEKTRPFCRKHVGHVLTRTQIDALDNGQLDNVFLTGGGYNCRHVWMAVSKFSELQPGDVIPEARSAA